MILDDIKTLENIEDASKDEKLNIYIRTAIYTIKTYLNNDKFEDEDIKEKFSEAIISLVRNVYNVEASGNKGIKSKSQGARSVTYADEKGFVIDEDIKSLLPPPYMKMR